MNKKEFRGSAGQLSIDGIVMKKVLCEWQAKSTPQYRRDADLKAFVDELEETFLNTQEKQ